MENNNLHSFDEQLKSAMEQFQPTPPADVWANVSSQIGNISTVSQVSLVSKIAAVITKNIILVTTSAAIVTGAIVYVALNNTDNKTEEIKIEEPKEIVVLDNNEIKPNKTEKIGGVENKELIPDNKNTQNLSKIEKVSNKKTTNKELSIEIPLQTEKQVIDNQVKDNETSGTNKIIQNILKQNQKPVENEKPVTVMAEVKKCNTGSEIKESYIGDNYYTFEPHIIQSNYNYVWYLGDGYIEFNSPKISHHYNDQSEDSYIVSLVLSKDGCKDSIVKKIILTKELKFNVYNVFTPNGDGQNDDWNIQIDNAGMYELRVMDYKGNIVFETKNNNEKWNGQVNNIGENCPRGLYTYMLIYKVKGQEKNNTLKGRVDLFR